MPLKHYNCQILKIQLKRSKLERNSLSNRFSVQRYFQKQLHNHNSVFADPLSLKNSQKNLRIRNQCFNKQETGCVLSNLLYISKKSRFIRRRKTTLQYENAFYNIYFSYLVSHYEFLITKRLILIYLS